ncbi:uncharacterized protein PgNI_04727, partial [Pyricularia grisea]|uniref:Uncharacterized protein n=1 Tax=Pyricularia grisea TaxID=148305 RepID=A0A6P8B8I1_PYRGI
MPDGVLVSSSTRDRGKSSPTRVCTITTSTRQHSPICTKPFRPLMRCFYTDTPAEGGGNFKKKKKKKKPCATSR